MSMCAHAWAALTRPCSPGQMFPVMHDGCAGAAPCPAPGGGLPFPLGSPHARTGACTPAACLASLPSSESAHTPGPWGGCGEHSRALHPTALQLQHTNSVALPTPRFLSPSHWVLSGPFCLCSPALYPRADLLVLQLTWGAPLTCLSRSLLSLHGAALLRKSSAWDGVEVGAAMGWVPQGSPTSYCWPHCHKLTRVVLSRVGVSAIGALMHRRCFRFTSLVKPELGHPQQEGEGSSETSGCSGPPTPSQHSHMAALHQEPGYSLPAAHDLTPHPAAQIWNPAPESSIPHLAS